MNVFLEAIKFNHDPASETADAFNIRKNDSEPAPFPEWQRGISFTAEDSVAAYAIEKTRGQTISIKAKFKRNDPALTTIRVQAVDANPPLSTRNVLGRVREAEVTFADNGESDFVTFLLDDVRLEQRGVGISKNIWKWQFRATPDSVWRDFAKTAHKIYTVLDVPQEPWSQDVSSGDNSQLPWTEVLDVACDWADSAQNAPQAAELITRNTYDLGYGLVTYQGGPASYVEGNFNCTGFLKLLRGQDGMGKTLNCSDCATIVTSLANILGCQTWEVNLSSFFLTNPIIVIGDSIPRIHPFTSHEIALTGDTLEQAAVFDACLQVDGDEDPANSNHFDPLLPVNLQFGLPNEHNYIFRASSDNSIVPLFQFRHRIKIGNRVRAKFADLDPRFIEFLKEQFAYESWRDAKIKNFNVPAFIGSSLLHGWLQVDKFSSTFVDNTVLTQLLWKSPALDPEVLIRLDVFECPGSTEARALLLRLLGEFRSVSVERIEHPVFADVAFVATDNTSVLFAYRELVVLIRSAGTKTISLRESINFAAIDRKLTEGGLGMPHDLQTTFTSKLFFSPGSGQPGEFRGDFLGDFDLNNISPDGNMAGCTRKGKPFEITGQATVATTPAPFVYDVTINQTRPVRATYRGVALRNDAGEVTRIVGHLVFSLTEAQRREFGIDKLLPPDQNETTWVATKP